jgi:transposase
MKLNVQQLTQIDEQYIICLLNRDVDALAALTLTLVNDLKEAHERLNQNPSNSSKPSGSLAPWDKGLSHNEPPADVNKDGSSAPISTPSPMDASNELNKTDGANSEVVDSGDDSASNEDTTKRKPGRQLGSQGYGRTQQLPVTHTEHHHCGPCQVCNIPLLAVQKTYTGFYSVNITFGQTDTPGIQLTNTLHIYYSAICPTCGLKNINQPWRAPAEPVLWENVGLTEWRLIGPDLAAMIVYLSMEMRITRRKLRLFLHDILGLELSQGSIQNCLVESARALAPVEESLVEDLLNETLIHADETSHKESGELLWLWVFISVNTALFLVGKRTKTIFTDLIASSESPFTGWLMSDGYLVYRGYLKRLRCWAHLERKALGLSECLFIDSKTQGEQMLKMLRHLMKTVYEAREGPDKGMVSISKNNQNTLRRLRELCLVMAKSSHKKTGELGREFLNDWDAIFRVLEKPVWPLTNNEAERALRHWVIMRRITQGTRSEQGSRTLALLASVIETCRLRNSSPILYIRDVIALRRQGKSAPELPVKITLISSK